MKNNLWILALVVLLGGIPVFAGDGDGSGDVGGNGQGTGRDEVKGDVGGNGQGSGDGPGVTGEGDVGGNGQGTGMEFLSIRPLEFYTAAVQQVKEHTIESDVLTASSRLLEALPMITVKVTSELGREAKSTDAHMAGVLDTRLNLLVLNQTIFDSLSKKEKASVLTHHLAKVAGIEEAVVAKQIAAAVR